MYDFLCDKITGFIALATLVQLNSIYVANLRELIKREVATEGY